MSEVRLIYSYLAASFFSSECENGPIMVKVKEGITEFWRVMCMSGQGEKQHTKADLKVFKLQGTVCWHYLNRKQHFTYPTLIW